MQPLNNLILFFSNNPDYLIGVVFLVGLIFGSFFNVVIYRTPLMLFKEWLKNTREFIEELYGKLPEELKADPENFKSGTFNLATPNSTCPKCNHEIKWYENIPLVSYAFLRGKCSDCKNPISIRYPAVELATGLLSAFVAYKLGATIEMLAILVLTWSFICLTMIDYDHHILPDQITLPLLWLGLILNINGLFVPLEDAVIGAAGGYLSLWTIYQLFKLATGKEGMGFGDFKLLAALGAWMGWEVLPLIILLSSLVGSVIGISFIIIKGRDKNIPFAFGPYLAIAGWISFFWGDAIIHYYKYQIL